MYLVQNSALYLYLLELYLTPTLIIIDNDIVDDIVLVCIALTISVRQAVIAARRSVMLAYGRPVYRQSQRQVLKSF